MPDYDSLQGFVVFDFESTFPYKFWISTWASDEHYPGGFRYKILSVRPEPEGLIEFVVLLEESSVETRHARNAE